MHVHITAVIASSPLPLGHRSKITKEPSLAFFHSKPRIFRFPRKPAAFPNTVEEVTQHADGKRIYISLEDKPGTLGQLCQALAEEGQHSRVSTVPFTKRQGLCPSPLWTIR